MSNLSAKQKGSTVEIYMEFPRPTEVICPSISDLMSQGRNFALPIVCDRTLVADLYSMRMFNESRAARKPVIPQGKMATTAARADFPMNNKFWVVMNQKKTYDRDENYYSGPRAPR